MSIIIISINIKTAQRIITTYKKQTGYALYMYVYVLCMYVYEKPHLLFQKEYYIIINNIHTHTYDLYICKSMCHKNNIIVRTWVLSIYGNVGM